LTKNAPSYKALLWKFDSCPKELRDYFGQFSSLIKNHQYQVCLAYLFLRIELAHNRTLYCGVVKLHRADSVLAQSVMDSQHLTRDGFLEIYERVFGGKLPATISGKLKQAVKVRDRVVHGKSVNDAQMREAMYDVLEYAISVNDHLQKEAGYKPFGDLRGFKGRGTPLEKSTTRWLLKGLGFGVS
jgi:hypothetical protein